MKKCIFCLTGDETGATAIEYGLIAAIICLGVVAGIGGLGGVVNDMFGFIVAQWPT